MPGQEAEGVALLSLLREGAKAGRGYTTP